MKNLLTICIILFLFTTITCVMAQDGSYMYGTINDEKELTNVHLKNQEDAPVISRLEAGECFLILSQGEYWTHVITLTGIKGYVHNSRVIVKSSALGIGTITDERSFAEVHYEASTNSQNISRVMEGEQFVILSNNDDMTQIITRFGSQGYIRTVRLVTIYPYQD